ncbi:glycosyltransferase [Cyclobacterium xiamenense]|uniref:glycosyltransferase n=1 Tax=Cyclobacterium xiamenense TaxID=1297121 RepID=UPI0019D4F37B|nr:glycosyltransferase [Cyclobacterium xiamenense]
MSESKKVSKDILIVTHGFYPEQSPRSFRATELAKEFCRQGHRVTVMAPYRQGTATLAANCGFEYKSLGNLTWKIFNFSALGLPGRLYNKAVNRLFPLLLEYPMMELFSKVRKALNAETKRYDLLISIAVPYPIHWGVASIWSADKNKNPASVWVADCGDPYCLQENDTFRPPIYFRWVEKWFMRKTDFITVPTQQSIAGYFLEFHSKMRVIPQGFRFEDLTQLPVKDDGIVRFGYGGSFIRGRRDPRSFLEFLCTLNASFRYEFHVYTTQKEFIMPYANRDSRIRVFEPIPRLDLLRVFSSFHFVVNFSNQGSAQTPSKLIDYAMMGKPILNIDTQEMHNERIIPFLKGDYQGRVVVANTENYRIENVCVAFLALLRQEK